MNDTPWFVSRRQFRIATQGTVFQVQYLTWILRRWRGCSGYYPNWLAAFEQYRKILNGLEPWREA